MESYCQVQSSYIYDAVLAKTERDNNFLMNYEKGLDEKITKTIQYLCFRFTF